jgi:hypothetical protein
LLRLRRNSASNALRFSEDGALKFFVGEMAKVEVMLDGSSVLPRYLMPALVLPALRPAAVQIAEYGWYVARLSRHVKRFFDPLTPLLFAALSGLFYGAGELGIFLTEVADRARSDADLASGSAIKHEFVAN